MSKTGVFSALKQGISFVSTFIILSASTACERNDLWNDMQQSINSVVANVQFNPSPGTYSNDQEIILSCATADAIIHYTTDGSTPNELSDVYGTPIPVTGDGTTMTINAIAIKSGLIDSDIATGLYIIDYAQVSTPQLLPPAGTYTSDQNVQITCSTPGATIHYTTDGSTPSELSDVYGTPIPVTGDGTTMTISAIAVLTGMENSGVISGDYIIDYAQIATPQFLPVAGTYTSDQNVQITCSTPGATIHYTTDGSTPSELSDVYGTPIPVTGDGTTMTISAIAVLTGMTDSNIVSQTYSIDYTYVTTPVITTAGGLYTSDQSVAITCATPGATIYYTTDGSTPTDASAVYSSPIPVTGNGTDCTINAIGILAGNTDSGIASANFQIRYVVYYTMGDTVNISTDGTATWTSATFSGNMITSVFTYGDAIYVGGSSYLNYYDGSTWTVRTFSGNITGLFVDSNYLYVSTVAAGMQYSSNFGATFGSTLSITSQRAIYVESSIIYLASDDGLWCSHSASEISYFNYPAESSHSPITTADGLPSNNLYDVFVLGTERYLATAAGVSVYTDTGADPGTCANYTIANGLADDLVYGICSDGTNIYAATANGLSIFNGSAWSTAITSIQCNRVRLSGSVIYVATDNGLYISYNNGATWDIHSAGNVILDVHVSPQ